MSPAKIYAIGGIGRRKNKSSRAWRFESFIAYKNKYRPNQARVYLVLDKVVRQGAVRAEVLVEA